MVLSVSEFSQIFIEILNDMKYQKEYGFYNNEPYYFSSLLQNKINLIDNEKYNLLLDFLENLAKEYLIDYTNDLNSLNLINEFISLNIEKLNKIIETS